MKKDYGSRVILGSPQKFHIQAGTHCEICNTPRIVARNAITGNKAFCPKCQKKEMGDYEKVQDKA